LVFRPSSVKNLILNCKEYDLYVRGNSGGPVKHRRDLFAITEEVEPVPDETGEEGPHAGETEEIRREIARLAKAQFKANLLQESAQDRVLEEMERLRSRISDASTTDGEWALDLVSIADGLDVGIQQLGSDAEVPDGAIEGFRIVQEKLWDLLKKVDITSIPTVGIRFDPHRHVAVAVESGRSVEDNTVLSEERRGYLQGDRVLRYAEVVVARDKESSERI